MVSGVWGEGRRVREKEREREEKKEERDTGTESLRRPADNWETNTY